MTDDLYTWANRWGCPAEAIVQLLDIVDPTRASLPQTTSETTEAAVVANLRVKAARMGCSLWRNNNGACVDDTGRHIRYGLGNDSSKLNASWKSSDLIGITPVMSSKPGQVFGVFAAVECKKPGWSIQNTDREVAQSNFLSTVKALGGLAMFAQSTSDYVHNIGAAHGQND